MANRPKRTSKPARTGVIYYGSTSPSMSESVVELEAQGMAVDLLRVRAFPFPDSVLDFIMDHERVFVVEQNRDGQLRTMLMNELEVDPARVIPILHYDGTPITARFITQAIAEMIKALHLGQISGKVA